MNPWANSVITQKGLALQAKLIAGTQLTITRAVTGTGYVTPGLLQQQTAVGGEKQELTFGEVTYPEEGKCALKCRLKNEGLTVGYTAMQVGVYATDPDEGEILYFITQAESNKGTEVPSETESPGFSAEWNFYFQFGHADGVDVTVDPSNTVSRADMESYAAPITHYHDEEYLKRDGDTMTGSLVVDGTKDFDGTGESLPIIRLSHSGYEVTIKVSPTGNVQIVKSINGVEKNYFTLTDSGFVCAKPMGINSGGTGATNAENALVNLGAAAAASHNIKTYTNLSQLGLSNGATMSAVARALPGSSMLRIYVLTSENSKLAPSATNGWLEVCRPATNHAEFHYATSTGISYFATVLNIGKDNEQVGEWVQIANASDLWNYLPLAGGTRTGNTLNFNNNGKVMIDGNGAILEAYTDTGDTKNRRGFAAYDSQYKTNIKDAFVLYAEVGGTLSQYHIYGEHNPKAGASSQDPGTSLLRNSKLVLTDEDPTVEGEMVWVAK
ncbi:MAG: hypothetical protein IKI93_16705 [Clostridia bacterium]|nr:hypothetical protein [Clostridia bacterium]